MAQSKRRGKDAVDESLTEALIGDADSDALDRDADDVDDVETDETDTELDEADTDLDDSDGDEDSDEDSGTAAERRKARKAAKEKAKSDDKDDKGVKVDREEAGPGIFGRFLRFIREVVAELRKVIWPTRKDLLTYTTVVIVFVAIMLTIVGGLDWVFAWGVLKVFGGK